jgi:metallo-beta-lactamase family protein
MKLTFLGATKTVTGSKYLLTIEGLNVLIDCGLFQGLKELRLRNWDKFPISPKTINAVILTHAHIDHSGYLPVLVRNGFKGSIYCTPATFDLCKILLPDSAKLQEEEARYANKKGYSKHKPALPLMSSEDVDKTLKLFKPIDFGTSFSFENKLTAKFIPNGHILGSAFVEIKNEHTSILFSGDLGRPNDLIMQSPKEISAADYLILESTYGDRNHDQTDPLIQLEEIINKTTNRKGVIIIPAFSVGRTQSILYSICRLKKLKKIKDIPVFLNSPMSINAMHVYCNHKENHKLSPDECKSMCEVATYVNSIEDSIALNLKHGPMIIVSASGMATGGRVLHHIKQFGPDSKNTILFVGFQAPGTRGDSLVHGAKSIKMYGEYVQVNAEVVCLDSYSSHADQSEILEWLKNFKKPPKLTFITHGELHSAIALQEEIKKHFKWDSHIPHYLEAKELL